MSRQVHARHSVAVALAAVLMAAPRAAFPSTASGAPAALPVAVPALVLSALPGQTFAAQSYPGLLALATLYTPQPGFVAGSGLNSASAGSPLTNAQRWYFSFLTQQRLIVAQVEELRQRLHQNLMGTDEFLEKLDPLLQKADRLYTQWKRIGVKNAARTSGNAGLAGRSPVGGNNSVSEGGKMPESNTSAPDTESNAASLARDDVAVGKCLNYLRLSIVNLFLGYADSNGRQIADAETQAGLSTVWRSRSMSFIRALEPPASQPES